MKVLDEASTEAVQFKGSTKNIQLKADLEAEKAILDVLEASGHDFSVIAEEGGMKKIGKDPQVEAYIDPLDGSSYFMTGNKRLCCSAVMFVQGGRVLASFVGDLLTKDIYHCDENAAYLNDKRVEFSREKKGERYFVATYAVKGNRLKEELPKLAGLAQEKILVWNNSGPLEQAMITTGQFDAVVDMTPVSLWDYAGAAISQKAGALLTTAEGTPFRFENIKQSGITARNAELRGMLLQALHKW